MKRHLALLLILTMLMTLAACSSKETPNGGNTENPGTAGDTGNVESTGSGDIHRSQLTVAVSREPKALIPYASNDTGTAPITYQIYESLIKLDKDMNKLPGLATAWEQIDDTHYRFTLREGVKFHNGNPFTAEDVLYTFAQNTASEATASTIGPVDVDGCVIENDHSIIIALSRVYPAFLNCCTLDISAIVDKETMESIGFEAYNNTPVGTGPFKFVEWISGDYIKMEANTEWWGGKINFDTLLLRYIPEGSTRAIEAESGGVDIAHILVSDAASTEASSTTNLGIYNILNTSYVSFNCAVEPFNNVKVRQAISLALDTEAIVEANFRGYSKVSQSFLAPDIWGYADVNSEYEGYDVERAKQLLSEAGYADGFTCTMVSNGNQTVAEMIQAQLGQIGIKVELNVTDFANWLDAITTGKQQMYIGGFTVSSGDATEAFAAFHSANLGPTNRSFYVNPAADALIERIDSTTDETARMAACVELQELLADECVTIGTNVGVAFYAVNKSIEGFYALPSQSFEFCYITFTE